jgi:sigma-B regulation protein RsbU (phosphoserine phosphatase)
MNKSSIYGNVNEIAPENKFLQGNKVSSILLVPIFAHDIFWGFIGFDMIESEKKWSQMEVETLTMVADSIGAAISRQANEDYLNQMYNSLLKELDIASSVQHYLLPDWLTKQDEIIFSSTYKPSSLIGGDLFDIIKLASGKTLVYIGDISGHGVQAALMMTAVKSIINMIVTSQEEQLSPSFILQKLNKILAADLFHENYLTILLCIIDEEKEEIRYFSAGHPPLIQYDLAQKEVKLIDEGGSIPVGWSLNFDYEPEAEGVVKFSSDKAFMLYTDGIFECENAAGEQFGLEGFHKFIEQHGDFTSAISLPEKFIDILQKQSYDISTDDFTLLTFKKIATKGKGKFQKIFTIQPNLENIADVGHKCNQIVRDRLQEEVMADQVELLINEYLSNIIRHGIEGDRAEVIGLEIAINEQVLLTFWDKGRAWELPEKDSDCLAAGIDRVGGFGMQIIYSIAAEISLNRLGELNETVIRIGRKENDGK